MTKILLVENDSLHAIQQLSILEGRFSDVQRVADAAEAFCLVEQPQFASSLRLVVSDLHMPGIGGPAFVAELRDRMPCLPVLALGNTTEDEGDYAGGCVRYLGRPFANEELLTSAHQMLSLSEPDRKAASTLPYPPYKA